MIVVFPHLSVSSNQSSSEQEERVVTEGELEKWLSACKALVPILKTEKLKLKGKSSEEALQFLKGFQKKIEKTLANKGLSNQEFFDISTALLKVMAFRAMSQKDKDLLKRFAEEEARIQKELKKAPLEIAVLLKLGLEQLKALQKESLEKEGKNIPEENKALYDRHASRIKKAFNELTGALSQ